MSTPIYLDYHATTPIDPRVVTVMTHAMREVFGNPHSSDHVFGDAAEEAVATARREVALLAGTDTSAVLFTSGATESANLALQGFVKTFGTSGRVPLMAISAVEHNAVLGTAEALVKDGLAQVVTIPVDGRGQLDLDVARRVIAAGVDLVAVMAANNEVGTIYPTGEVAQLARAAGAAFFCDITQALGKVPLALGENVTFAACSAHKIYGPKGVGALLIGRHASLLPVTYGGGQERGFRPGTMNVPAITAFGEACRLRRLEMHVDEPRVGSMRDALERALRERIDGLVVNGDPTARLAGNLHVAIAGVPNGAIIARVRERLAIATGAACSSGIESPSHVLAAMRLDRTLIDGALRIGLGKFTKPNEVADAASILADAASDARRSLL